MNSQMKVSSGGIPAGTYVVKFTGCEDVPENQQLGYGAGLRWTFEVITGEQRAQKTSRITSPVPSEKNACGKILAGLAGRALKSGESVDWATFLGKTYIAVVAMTQGGGTRVETVIANSGGALTV